MRNKKNTIKYTNNFIIITHYENEKFKQIFHEHVGNVYHSSMQQ